MSGLRRFRVGFAERFAFGFAPSFALGFTRASDWETAIPHPIGDCGNGVLPTYPRHIEVGT
jgi:hypothetical protein